MKRRLYVILTCLSFASFCFADIKLPVKCEAFLPTALYKNTTVISESEANKINSFTAYGQNTPPSDGDYRYWIVYSDRNGNTTYLGPGYNSGKHSTLGFNEKLRIAKIEGDFALVYSEPKNVEYPAISSVAESKGWVPMENLLLWTKCLSNDIGIYYKALLVVNLDQTSQNSKDLLKVYKNPDITNVYDEIETGMSFYFIMKRDKNGLVLLSREYSLEGASDQMLYGWVSQSSYVPWNQRSCIEPNWDPEAVAKFKESSESARIYADKSLSQYVNQYPYGKKFYDMDDDINYRLPADVLRYPILDNDTGNDNVYKCTTFGTVNGDLSQIIEETGESRKKQMEVLDKMKRLNLIVVIDGTRSMGKYFPAVKDAIKRGCEFFGENYTPRIGLVIYRDYSDGEDGLVEYVPMSVPDDPRLIEYLDNGGEYGIKSSSNDRTNEEALYKGLEVALDSKKMGYNQDESNLMLVIGDCGNDENDTKCLSQSELIKRFIDNRICLMAFQVRRNNDPAWLAYNRQLSQILIQNIQKQYDELNIGLSVKFEKCTDGMDLVTNNGSNHQFFIGSIRYTTPGVDLEPMTLTRMMEKNLGEFGAAVQARTDALVNAGNGSFIKQSELSNAQMANSSRMDSAYVVSQLGLDAYNMLMKTRKLLALSGYTKKESDSGYAYWRPIVFVSADEFSSLIERLTDVNVKAKTDDRKPYVEAMKQLLKTMLPDIQDKEMDQKGTTEIMNMITGLNEASAALKGPRLIDIQDPTVVTPAEFRKLITDFQRKYRNLVNIKNDKDYPFIYNYRGVSYYWIPIEELP